MEQPVTYQEFQQMKQYYETKLQIKDEIIDGLEVLLVDTLSQVSNKVKEVDALTKLAFENPLMNKNERSC